MTLRQLVLKSGKTCTEIGYRCSITEQTVRNWMYGKYLPKLDIVSLNTMLEVLGCSFEDLYTAVLNTQKELEEKRAAKSTKANNSEAVVVDMGNFAS